MKEPIAILDTGLGGFNVFYTLVSTFPGERFIYQNNLKFYPYSARPEPEIEELINADIDEIMREKPKILIIVADTVVEYACDKLEKIKIPVIRIDKAIIEYVNQDYEQKNMVLLARQEIIAAKIYQKNFVYNHLYNIASDEMESVIENEKTKTARSFAVVRKAFSNVINNDVDIIITSTPILINLKTEIREYMQFQAITDVGIIIANKLMGLLSEEKGRGERVVKTSVPAKIFRRKAHWLKFKYKIREY